MKIRSIIFSLSMFLLLCISSSIGFSKSIFLYGDLSLGGEKISNFDDSTHDARAGGLFHIAAGKVFELSDIIFFSAALGMKYDSSITSETNENDLTVSFIRFPLELALEIPIREKHRAGLGLSYHIAPRISVRNEDNSSLGNVNLDNALGLFASYQMNVQGDIAIGIKYTNIDYSPKSNSDVEIDGNSVSIFTKVYF